VTTNHDLVNKLFDHFDALRPLLREHLEEMDGELLPYLVLADVARWAQTTYATDAAQVGALVDWLEDSWGSASADQRDLIGLGFVEVIPYPPEGGPLLARLGPNLTQVANDLGLLAPHDDLG
jgi:hypothetical protein